MTQESFAEFLKSASGKSVQEIREQSGLTRPTICYYLQGKRNPTRETIAKLGTPLGITDDTSRFTVAFGRPKA